VRRLGVPELWLFRRARPTKVLILLIRKANTRTPRAPEANRFRNVCADGRFCCVFLVCCVQVAPTSREENAWTKEFCRSIGCDGRCLQRKQTDDARKRTAMNNERNLGGRRQRSWLVVPPSGVYASFPPATYAWPFADSRKFHGTPNNGTHLPTPPHSSAPSRPQKSERTLSSRTSTSPSFSSLAFPITCGSRR